MRLAPRLVLAFGFLAALSVAGLGYVVRENRWKRETERFDKDVKGACSRVSEEVKRQAAADLRLISVSCESTQLVDQAAMYLEAGELDSHRLALARQVPRWRDAFGLDEMLLATDRGEILGGDPHELLALSRAEVESRMKGDAKHALLRTGPKPALVAVCLRKAERRGASVGLEGVRWLPPLLTRLGDNLGVNVTVGSSEPAAPAVDMAYATCPFTDAAGTSVTLVVTKPKQKLYDELAQIDETVLFAGLASTGLALMLAVLLARSLGRPIAELAAEARKVATGEARPLRVRGSGEIGDLVVAFDRMLDDLAVTRRRLAATSRVAAWREVARRVAHEVKNPLAPIRAAVETLRRLRARNDPAFDEYFDEASRTVLDEVHRIANIVTEFTRFARLPPPRPQELDLIEVVRHVIQLQKAGAGKATIDLVVRRAPPLVRADRDQVIQVLTNLVANALDAVGAKDGAEGGEVTVSIDSDGAGHAILTVTDNGPGIPPEIAARLFEPYATTKAHGTGLGLAIAQRIAIEHNGELSCVASRSSEGGRSPRVGAVFRFVLPVDGPPPVSEMSGEALALPMPRRGTASKEPGEPGGSS